MKILFALISELLLFRGGANKNVRLRFTYHENKNIVDSIFSKQSVDGNGGKVLGDKQFFCTKIEIFQKVFHANSTKNFRNKKLQKCFYKDENVVIENQITKCFPVSFSFSQLSSNASTRE